MVTLGDSAGTQTQDPQLRRLLLYSAELPNQHLLASAKLMLYFDLDKILTHVMHLFSFSFRSDTESVSVI